MQPTKHPIAANTKHNLVTTLYEQFAPSILINIRRHLPSHEDAEDILVEVFLAVLEHPNFSTLDEEHQLAWLRRVAQNKCADFFRRHHRRPFISLDQKLAHNPFQDDTQEDPEQIALRAEEHQNLYAQLANLPANQQRVLLLRFGADMRCVDIARELNLSEGTVRGWLSRSLNLLRTIYRKQ